MVYQQECEKLLKDPMRLANDMRKGIIKPAGIANGIIQYFMQSSASKGNQQLLPFGTGGPLPPVLPDEKQAASFTVTVAAEPPLPSSVAPQPTAPSAFPGQGTQSVLPTAGAPGLFSKALSSKTAMQLPAVPAHQQPQTAGQDALKNDPIPPDVLAKARRFNITLPAELTLTEQDLEQFRAMSFNADMRIPEAVPPSHLRL
jgi:hypothetical protein